MSTLRAYARWIRDQLRKIWRGEDLSQGGDQ